MKNNNHVRNLQRKVDRTTKSWKNQRWSREEANSAFSFLSGIYRVRRHLLISSWGRIYKRTIEHAINYSIFNLESGNRSRYFSCKCRSLFLSYFIQSWQMIFKVHNIWLPLYDEEKKREIYIAPLFFTHTDTRRCTHVETKQLDLRRCKMLSRAFRILRR